MTNGSVNHSRRSFLRGGMRSDQLTARQPAPRLPWADRTRFFSNCTRCGECARQCNERIIVTGDGGFPEIDFQRGECIFCGKCRDACPEALLSGALSEPWHFKAAVNGDCLSAQGISCQSCRDACESRAIRFRPQLGGVSLPEIDTDLCNGCGACVSPCPVAAITVGEEPAAVGEPHSSNKQPREAAHA